MEWVKPVLDVILNQFLTKFEVMLTLVVTLGYVLLRRPAARVISGAIKTAVGIMILQAGSAYLTTNFRPVLDILQKSFNMKGVIIDPYAGLPAATAALKDYAGYVGYTIIIAFALNILYVRFTKARAVFLTGHVMFIQSAIATWCVKYTTGLDIWPSVLIAAFLLSLYWTVFPHLLIKPTSVVIGGREAPREEFTLGHQQMLADVLAFRFGSLFGKPEESVEKVTLPGWLAIIQDNVVATSVIMTLFVSAFMLAAGPAAVQAQAGAQHWFIYMLFMGLRFAVAIAIILSGVRMFVSELVSSFKGVSEKLLPGAVAAIDCPAVFPFAPKAVTLGFICTVIGQVIGIATLILSGSPIMIIPGFVPLFFDGGPVGVYANASGGWRATVVCCMLLGFVHIWGARLVIPVTGMVGGWIGNFDWSTMWSAVFWGLKAIFGGI
ncbi:MAG: PTS ascorbate transporter subunit IIC [Firmicutes bacterium]|nr:PTS ascorbate transporter subunit IIC [Bacillota bacterium]